MANFFEKLTSKHTSKYIQFVMLLLVLFLIKVLFQFLYPMLPYQLTEFYYSYEQIIFAVIMIIHVLSNKDRYHFIPTPLLGVSFLLFYINFEGGCILFLLMAYLIENTPDKTTVAEK